MSHIRFVIIHLVLVFIFIGCSNSENEIKTISEFDPSINYEGLDINYDTILNVQDVVIVITWVLENDGELIPQGQFGDVNDN